MTNQAETSGSSLFQARKTTQHHHNHQHLHLHQHRRLHSHARAEGQPPGPDGTTPHVRSPPTEKLHDRQVVVVQTVSVVHYIDGTGATTSVSTLRSDPVAPPPVETPAGVIAGLTTLGDALPSVSLSGLIPDIIDGAPSTTSTTASTEPEPEPSSSASLSASSETLTSTPFSSSSVFPTLSTGIFNSSTSYVVPSLFNNSTVALFSNSTRTSHHSSHITFTSTTKSSSSSTRLTSTTTSVLLTTVDVDGVAGGDANTAAGAPAPAATSTEPSSGSGSGLTPETRNAVVGGVVGTVACIALIAFAFLFFLRWRKQHGKGIMLLGDGDSAARGKGVSSGTPASPRSGGGMAERSGAFAIPAALANLTGKRAIDAPPAEPVTQEKGFYRVSGKKLVSVLESGGDGYSDPHNPHDSVGSNRSYFRDSQAFLDDSNDSPLQLGSPMRPVSGVVVMRNGPGRTPIQESALSSPGHRPSAFPTTTLPVPDQVGRSLASRDGSRGSGSRFTEEA